VAIRALIFDVDGTLAETESVHLAAFNEAFAKAGLDWTWDHDLYRELLRVTGGRERILHYAKRLGPGASEISAERAANLHAAKNALYGETIRQGECRLRPGVERLIRTSHARGLRLAICTTTSRSNFDALITSVLGADGLSLFQPIVCGEDVRHKKPAPEAYFRVIDELGVPASDCLAFEDSSNGLRAALAANLRTIVTPSLFTDDESFEGAFQVLPNLEHFDPSKFSLEAPDA